MTTKRIANTYDLVAEEAPRRSPFEQRHLRVLLVPLLVAFAIVLLAAAMANAAGTVTSCGDDTELAAALAGGGPVTFDCGGTGERATIALRSTLTITGVTSIDGAGKITLSGEGALRLFVVNPNARLFLQSIALESGSTDGDGGAILNAGLLSLADTVVRDSYAGGGGGAIATTGPMDMRGGGLFANQASGGGGLFASGGPAHVTVVNAALQDNRVLGSAGTAGRGGAIRATASAGVDVNLSDVSNNDAEEIGGGIAVDDFAAVGMIGSSVHDNHASAGGGIMNLGGTIILDSSAVWRNDVWVTGGGIKNESGLALLTNVTISGNSAFGGGGLYNYNAQANLTNVTIADNAASNVGGGLTNSSFGAPHLLMKNVLLSGNAPGGNCVLGAAADSSVGNVSSDGSCGFGAGRDDAATALGSLGTNGGLTPSHRLVPGSAAIDAGTTSGCPAGDQRSSGRYTGHSCDAGAVEFVPCLDAPTEPHVLAPADKAKPFATLVLLDWAGPDCATDFSVVVRRGSRTGRIVFSQSGITDTEVTTPELRRGRKYFWQLTACNASGCTTTPWLRFKIRATL